VTQESVVAVAPQIARHTYWRSRDERSWSPMHAWPA